MCEKTLVIFVDPNQNSAVGHILVRFSVPRAQKSSGNLYSFRFIQTLRVKNIRSWKALLYIDNDVIT